MKRLWSWLIRTAHRSPDAALFRTVSTPPYGWLALDDENHARDAMTERFDLSWRDRDD